MFSFCVLHYLQGLREAVATLPSKRISDRYKGSWGLLDYRKNKRAKGSL